MVDVASINITQRFAVLTDGRCVPVTNLFDRRGEETTDAWADRVAVCGEGDEWLTVDLANFLPVTVH